MAAPRRPTVGVSCYFDSKEKYYEVYSNYCTALERNGAIPVILPIVRRKTLGELLTRLDGLLLAGGPGTVGKRVARGESKILPPLRKQNPKRYDFEKILIEETAEMGLPILGICRGHQMIGEVLGGKMCLNIKDCFSNPIEHYQKTPGSKASHEITIDGNSRLFNFFRTQKLNVNSFHRQCLIEAPEDFIVSAKSPDGVIEAIEHRKKFIFGVQFHPEKILKAKPIFNNIFRQFIKECSKR